jgi:hypothetical protein
VCPNCHKTRESLLGDNADERRYKLTDFFYKYGKLERASKRNRYLFWIIICLCILVTILAFIFFITVQEFFANKSALYRLPLKNTIFFFFLHIFLLGVSGFQCIRIKKELSSVHLWLGRGILRRFRDGRVVEFFYSTVVFIFLIWCIVTFWGETEWIQYYYELKVSVSKELYILVGMGSLYAVAIICFAWHILGNFLCPYDYKSELKMRLDIWHEKRNVASLQ